MSNHHSTDEANRKTKQAVSKTPTSQRNSTSDQRNTKTADNLEKPHKWRDDLREQWEKEPIAVIGLATGFLVVVFAALQWWAVIDTSRTNTRAWIGPKTDSMKLELHRDKPMNILIDITNYGQTPALKLSSSTGGQIMPNEWKPTPSMLSCSGNSAISARSPEVTMFPQDLRVIGGDFADQVISDPILADYKSGRAHLWFWGCIWYQDIYGANHLTEFCKVTDGTKPGVLSCGIHGSAN